MTQRLAGTLAVGFGLAALLALLTGCAGVASTVEALGKDQNTVCAQASTPYGSGSAIRSGMLGYRITSSGTGCSVESVK